MKRWVGRGRGGGACEQGVRKQGVREQGERPGAGGAGHRSGAGSRRGDRGAGGGDDGATSGSDAAAATLRAASLLRGGVSAGRVWRVLGEEPDAPAELRALAARLAEGQSVSAALAGQGGQVVLGGGRRGRNDSRSVQQWRVLAAAWNIAEQSGAPLAPVLERLADALSSLERLAERRSVLLAAPRATVRLVASLPPLALVMGAVLGFDPFEVMLSPFGAMLAAVGCGLLGVGVQWARWLTNRLANAEWVAGLECELTWVALAGGGAPGPALRRVADCVDLAEARWVRLSSLCRDGTVRTVLAAAANLGTAAGPMLLAEAHGARARALAELEREAERLGVRVLIPLGVCVLPSFIVLGVLPVLFAVLGTLSW